jgi:DNA-binding transcriptional regulator YiaG
MDAIELKRIRIELGLGQTALAKLLKTPLRTYVRWECGDNRFPGMIEVALETVRSGIEKERKDLEKK